MQVGDLVTYYFQRPRWRKGQSVHVGLVVETGKYTGNKDVKVMWKLMREEDHDGKSYIATEASQHLSLIDSSLTQS